MPDLSDAAWNLIWAHTRPDLHPNMKLNQSMFDRIYPSDKFMDHLEETVLVEPL
jgi:hypothetical protein